MIRNAFINLSQSLSMRVFAILGIALGLGLNPVYAQPGHEGHNKGHERPAWLDKLENQVNYEEMMGGMEGRQEKMDNTFMKLMDRLQGKIKEHAVPASSGGGYHDSWSAHQLQQSYLLGPTEAGAMVSKGSHCPSNAPVKQYNVSAINVEIMLNQWGDYFPGYMYVLDEDISEFVRKKRRIKSLVRMSWIQAWYRRVFKATLFSQ